VGVAIYRVEGALCFKKQESPKKNYSTFQFSVPSKVQTVLKRPIIHNVSGYRFVHIEMVCGAEGVIGLFILRWFVEQRGL